jgi:hypothetical protein
MEKAERISKGRRAFGKDSTKVPTATSNDKSIAN